MKKKTRTGIIVFALIIVAVGVYMAALNIHGRKEVRRITETVDPDGVVLPTRYLA